MCGSHTTNNTSSNEGGDANKAEKCTIIDDNEDNDDTYAHGEHLTGGELLHSHIVDEYCSRLLENGRAAILTVKKGKHIDILYMCTKR